RDRGVRDRLDPPALGRDVQVGLDRLPGRPEVHGPGPALGAPNHVQADVGGDAVEPGTHRRAPLEALGAAPRPYEGLLDGVLRLERRAEHPVAVRGQMRPVWLELAELGGD